jgi:hypothetical protein
VWPEITEKQLVEWSCQPSPHWDGVVVVGFEVVGDVVVEGVFGVVVVDEITDGVVVVEAFVPAFAVVVIGKVVVIVVVEVEGVGDPHPEMQSSTSSLSSSPGPLQEYSYKCNTTCSPNPQPLTPTPNPQPLINCFSPDTASTSICKLAAIQQKALPIKPCEVSTLWQGSADVLALLSRICVTKPSI